jgi:hypothetical protein
LKAGRPRSPWLLGQHDAAASLTAVESTPARWSTSGGEFIDDLETAGDVLRGVDEIVSCTSRPS